MHPSPLRTDRSPTPRESCMELGWRIVQERCVCSDKTVTGRVGTLLGWCSLLVLGEALGQSGFVGQSDQLWVTSREKGLNYSQILVLMAMKGSSSYFTHTGKILGCLQIVEGCVLPID